MDEKKKSSAKGKSGKNGPPPRKRQKTEKKEEKKRMKKKKKNPRPGKKECNQKVFSVEGVGDGSWMPLSTRVKQYCNPALIVLI